MVPSGGRDQQERGLGSEVCACCHHRRTRRPELEGCREEAGEGCSEREEGESF